MKKGKIITISIIIFLILILSIIILYNVTPFFKSKEVTNKKEDTECLNADKKCTKIDIDDGIKVRIKVNNTDEYTFYVLSADESYATLLLDENIGYSKFATKDNQEGPINLIETLSKKTSLWTNVNYLEYYSYFDKNHNDLMISDNEYDPKVADDAYSKNPGGYIEFRVDEGVTKIISEDEKELKDKDLKDKLRVRTLTYEDIEKLKNNDKLPNFLISNLSNGEGYWTLSTAPSKKNNTDAYCIINDKGEAKLTTKKIDKSIGIRPVIVVNKDLIK